MLPRKNKMQAVRLEDLPPEEKKADLVNVKVRSNNNVHDQTARQPQKDQMDTGVDFYTGEKRIAKGRSLVVTGENYNAEQRGRLFRSLTPARDMEFTAESGKALAELVQPHL